MMYWVLLLRQFYCCPSSTSSSSFAQLLPQLLTTKKQASSLCCTERKDCPLCSVCLEGRHAGPAAAHMLQSVVPVLDYDKSCRVGPHPPPHPTRPRSSPFALLTSSNMKVSCKKHVFHVRSTSLHVRSTSCARSFELISQLVV